MRLDDYIASALKRLRGLTIARSAALAVVAILAVAGAGILILRPQEFPSVGVNIARIALGVSLIAIALVSLWLPLRRLRLRRGADELERRLPDQQGRLATYLDAQSRTAAERSPLIALLEEDALTIAKQSPIEDIVPRWQLFGAVVLALAGIAVLIGVLGFTGGPFGYGARHILLGQALPKELRPDRSIAVHPGDARVRKNADLTLRAQAVGFKPAQATVFVKYDDETGWQQAPMRTNDRGEFEFTLFAIRGALQYYVTAQAVRSTDHRVSVLDLPKIEDVRLTYRYPAWTGLETTTDSASRDIRAVAGTEVALEIKSDQPLTSPMLIVNDAKQSLEGEASIVNGKISVKAPGRYHINARVADEDVQLTDDYLITLVEDAKPTIQIGKPGRDWSASSIEEVPVDVKAQDDFRVQNVELKYAINGGEWHSLKLGGGAKTADTLTYLRLEELGKAQPQTAEAAAAPPALEPGDLIAYYAVATDHKQTAKTDLYTVQVRPFERNFTEEQSGGGGGNGGGTDQEGAISQRQKELLLATWNLQRQRDDGKSPAQIADNSHMLSELESTLAEQTRKLAVHAGSSPAARNDPKMKSFVESLNNAAEAMDPAAQHLKSIALTDAIPSEQKALQHLLHAEAVMRDVQVAMQRGNGNGSQSQRSRTDFSEMLELEMDLDKNRYEMQSQAQQETAQQEREDLLRKLRELAERQERLADRNKNTMDSKESRYRQEQLRREAEDLRRQLEELQRSAQSSDRNSPSNEQLANATRAVQQALDNMQPASSNQSSSDQNSRRSAAGQNLRRAADNLKQPDTNNDRTDSVERLAQEARDLSDRQGEFSDKLQQTLSRARKDQTGSPRRDKLTQQQAYELANQEDALAEKLRKLQASLRSATQQPKSPNTNRRIGEALRDLDTAETSTRLDISAQQILRGYAIEAAARQGLITESLDKLRDDLEESARMAANEGSKKAGTSEDATRALAMELRQLRRAVDSAKAKADERAQAQNGLSPGGQQRPGEQQGGARGQPSEQEGGRRATEYGGPSGSLALQGDVLGDEPRAIAERLSMLANQLRGRTLSAADIAALDRLSHAVRTLAGNPLGAQAAQLSKLIDQVEVATLAANEKARGGGARTQTLEIDSPEYREAIAEYYRRLGVK